MRELNIDDKLRIAYGIALDQRCHEMHLKKQTVADRAGIARPLMSHYTQLFRLPNVIVAHRICEALDWTVEDWNNAAIRILNKEGV